MKLFFTIVLCFVNLFSFSQDDVLSKLPKTATSIKSFIPAGWIVIDSARGDFNNDQIGDYALIIIDSISEKMVLDDDRALIIIRGEKGKYSLSEYSENAILCRNCGGVHGDPLQGIEFKNNVLWIYHYGGSGRKWSYIHKFQFRKGHWYLIGKTTNYWWAVSDCEKLNDFAGVYFKDENFLTGEFKEKEISDECVLLKNRKGRQNTLPLLRLNKFNIDN